MIINNEGMADNTNEINFLRTLSTATKWIPIS